MPGCGLQVRHFHRIEIRRLDFPRRAKNHPGHARVVVRADHLALIELYEAEREIDALFEILEVDVAMLQARGELLHRFC